MTGERVFTTVRFKKSRPSSARGLTVIELLLVLLLLSVVVGLIVPRMTLLFFHYEFHSTVEQIEKTIYLAFYSAVRDNTVYRLSIDTRQKRFTVFKKDKNGEEDTYIPVTWPGGPVIALPDAMQFAPTVPEAIYFFPDGSSTVESFTLHDDSKKVSFLLQGHLYSFKVVYR